MTLINALSSNAGQSILDETCWAIKSFFLDNGGLRTIKKNLYYLLLTAFSEDTVLAWDDIRTVRVLQRSLSKLIETLHRPYSAGILDGVTVDYPYYRSYDEYIEPGFFFIDFFESRSHGEWRTVMEELFGAALIHDSAAHQWETVGNPLEVEAFLLKLLKVSECVLIQWRRQKFPDPAGG